MAMLDDLADYALAALPAEVIYLSEAPDQPDALTVLAETPGGPAMPTQEDALMVVRHRLQVLCRGNDYAPTRARAQALHDLYGRAANLTINATRYLRITAIQQPFGLPRDGNNRAQVAFNLEIERSS